MKTYLGFLKNYKMWAFLIIFFAALFELKSVFEKFLFKVLIDNGTKLVANEITNSAFTSVLIIIGIVYAMAIIVAVVSTWLKNHFVNKLESGMIADLKRKYLII
jgi:ABC-type multidrug transport system fused ATPase/permease subunit